jgi:hypothetical protein
MNHRGWPHRTPLTREEDTLAPGQLRAPEREAVPDAGGELGEQGEPVAPDQGVPPLHRPAVGVAESADGQRSRCGRDLEVPLFGAGCHHRADMLTTGLKPRYDMWLLKRYGLPALYWNVMLKGRLD